jgi:hypothetical protein
MEDITEALKSSFPIFSARGFEVDNRPRKRYDHGWRAPQKHCRADNPLSIIHYPLLVQADAAC